METYQFVNKIKIIQEVGDRNLSLHEIMTIRDNNIEEVIFMKD